MQSPTISSTIASMRQQLDGIANFVAQTYSNGPNRVARFRETIETMPRPELDAKITDPTKTKIETPDVDFVNSVRKAIEDMNDFMHSMNKMVRFDLHEQSGRFFVRLVDMGKGEVVAQFPAEALLQASTKVRAVKLSDGLLVNELPWMLSVAVNERV